HPASSATSAAAVNSLRKEAPILTPLDRSGNSLSGAGGAPATCRLARRRLVAEGAECRDPASSVPVLASRRGCSVQRRALPPRQLLVIALAVDPSFRECLQHLARGGHAGRSFGTRGPEPRALHGAGALEEHLLHGDAQHALRP